MLPVCVLGREVLASVLGIEHVGRLVVEFALDAARGECSIFWRKSFETLSATNPYTTLRLALHALVVDIETTSE